MENVTFLFIYFSGGHLSQEERSKLFGSKANRAKSIEELQERFQKKMDELRGECFGIFFPLEAVSCYEFCSLTTCRSCVRERKEEEDQANETGAETTGEDGEENEEETA